MKNIETYHFIYTFFNTHILSCLETLLWVNIATEGRPQNQDLNIAISREDPFVCRKLMLLPAPLTSQMLILIQNIYTAKASIKTWDSKCLALIAQLGHSAWIRRLGVRVPLRSRHFLSQKLWRFHKNICSCVERECCYPRTINISNVNFASEILSCSLMLSDVSPMIFFHLK